MLLSGPSLGLGHMAVTRQRFSGDFYDEHRCCLSGGRDNYSCFIFSFWELDD